MADAIKAIPNEAVSDASVGFARDGFTSTISIEPSWPVSPIASATKWASRNDKPPRTMVPVAFANSGSTASMSNDKCKGLGSPFGKRRCFTVSSMTFPIPYLSTSCMVKVLMPRLRIKCRSPLSMSRRPTKTSCSGFSFGMSAIHSNPGRLLVSVSPINKPKGIPCMFPEGEVSGVFKSACASTQIMPTSGRCLRIPATVPVPSE
mmetsp:Transcript_2650/g.3798  ORF Transcript_2650/g.3798 Transcript_2650/m.3798 type:complete len:205 (-) Transcript_2650:862-1476(-)